MSESTVDWDALLARFPSAPADVIAVPEPSWDLDGIDIERATQRTVPEVVARFRDRQTGAVFNDAWLEGISYTEPEIVEVMGGTHVPGHTEGEEFQVRDMQRAVGFLIDRVQTGEIEPGQQISDDLHLFISAHLGLKSTAFRGDQRAQYEGPLVALGRGERFRALDARLTHGVFDAGLRRILAIEHPVLRGATWAAFAAYEQFYLDGNKRTGRYVMNAVLLSHGFDAILVPAALKADYEDVVVAALRSGDLTDHVAFLVGLYPGAAGVGPI
ncbi:hypothetical protein [Frondihabitans australicus]|uniref:Fido domain-containing protein n=1 Tax=Frondihabitans australicus TaxID=386892 RepID=A0A495IE51_9MICO|nr:hypothetical protein [Frondihabitans australicus]RKR73405.1 hypothetical protein C8E83_0497 [Frondihabitans australicus]